MHFTTTLTTEDKDTIQNWCKMSFKSDVIDILKTYRHLPVNNSEKSLQLSKDMKELQEKAEQLQEENTKLRE